MNRLLGPALTLPAVTFIAVGFVLPVLILLSEAVTVQGAFSLAPIIGFFRDPGSVEVFWRTIRLAGLVTLTSAVIGYATAIAIVDSSPSARGRLIGTLILPLMVSPVARTYAWVVVLGRTGLVNIVVVGLGLSPEPLRLLFTETAVFIGLVQLLLPLMVLSLVSALENIPADVVPAARVLGAGWFTTFFKVTLPLTREGLVVGGTLVFTGALTAYITPAILGGSKVLMLETLLYQRIRVTNDIAAAGVIAIILVVLSITANVLLKRIAGGRSA
ncbi:ABC transporter permease [Lacibacterium aquatile]|uniref:ABC transporter permease n=1 Tax=Lacibacterium aquatile TaxID=1168082 RepID=A0ABW5DLZ1_9PROT